MNKELLKKPRVKIERKEKWAVFLTIFLATATLIGVASIVIGLTTGNDKIWGPGLAIAFCASLTLRVVLEAGSSDKLKA